MNSKLSNVIIFAAGAALGSIVTWKLVKTKYEQIAQEEINSVKEMYGHDKHEDESTECEEDADDDYIEAESERCEKLREAVALGVDTSNAPDIMEYAQKVGAIGYSEKEDNTNMKIEKPYLIRPDEFDMFEDYEAITLTYYKDGVLADEQDNVIEDVEGIVGVDSLNHFGENVDDPDTVYVRNDTLKCDYEILRDCDEYSNLYPGE